MFVPFDTLPDHARVWIYQADKKFSSSDKDIISNELAAFTEQWLVHGEPMKASFKIYSDHHIVLAADEGYNAASGCSIDGSVRVIKSLGQELSIDFFNRNLIAFKKEEGTILIPLSALKQKNQEGLWGKETETFNTLVQTKGELETIGLAPAANTWLKRYLTSETVSA